MWFGFEYFGNLEHYCFKKYDISDIFSQSVTTSMTSYQGKYLNLANEVITVYFLLSEFFHFLFLFI